MKAELYKRTIIDSDGLVQKLASISEEEHVLTIPEADEVIIGRERIAFLTDGDALAIDKHYRRGGVKDWYTYRLIVDGGEIPTTGINFERLRLAYNRRGEVVKLPL